MSTNPSGGGGASSIGSSSSSIGSSNAEHNAETKHGAMISGLRGFRPTGQ